MPSGPVQTQEQMIERFRKIHGLKYDYSKVKCTNCTKAVLIICPNHGEFWQIARNHYKGSNCPKCPRPVPITQNKELQEQIIAKFKSAHGNKYDYSKVVFKGLCKKVLIICPNHGEFWKLPRYHYNGQGCKKCSRIIVASKQQQSQEHVIARFKEVHGSLYDYSKVIFKHSGKKVLIICPNHGDFYQTPSNHYRGFGCNQCAKEDNKLAHAQVIDKFREVHGNKYDYSKVSYKGSTIKVVIICSRHGEFLQIPASHWHGCGCPPCAAELMSEKSSKGLDWFIDRLKKNTSPEFVNNLDFTNVTKFTSGKFIQNVKCKRSNKIFSAWPHCLIQGYCCDTCNKKVVDDRWTRKHKKYTEEFFKKVKNIHGDLYDYSKTNYINRITPIIIICKYHGEFKQKAGQHLRGHGCQICGFSQGEAKIAMFLKEHNIEYTHQYKVKIDNSNHWFDFYLSSQNLIIEFHGQQHYTLVPFFGGQKSFELQQKRDLIKTKYCNDNGIDQLVISYKDKDKIDDILTKKLQVLINR